MKEIGLHPCVAHSPRKSRRPCFARRVARETRVGTRCSRLQLALELVQKTPIRAVGDDLLRSRFDQADVAQAQSIVPDRVLGVVFAPFVTILTQRLEGIVVARGETTV